MIGAFCILYRKKSPKKKEKKKKEKKNCRIHNMLFSVYCISHPQHCSSLEMNESFLNMHFTIIKELKKKKSYTALLKIVISDSFLQSYCT